MIKQLLVVILVIIAIVAVVAMRKPDSFRVERSITINAPPDRIFPLVNDFKNFGLWSPWEHLDPNMSRSITGSPSGVGAIYEWSGNSKAGAGKMEILESKPTTLIKTRVSFIKPIAGDNLSEYTFAPSGSATKVTWVMSGPSPFISKVMQVFISMDDMIGKDFEKGLAAMKAEAEKPHA